MIRTHWLAWTLITVLRLVVASAHGKIVINEIHHNPPVKTELTEFIELYNDGTNTVDLGGWQFTSGVQFQFPSGTQLAPGAYLVVAENPAHLQQKFGVNALGPFTGNLNSQGESIKLRNALGQVEDEVDYQLGFPWPTVGGPPGYSIELIHPSLDNNLGGSWRASTRQTQNTNNAAELIPSQSVWKYRKGTAEASNPVEAWRTLDYQDASWISAPAPIGYGESYIASTLSDMQGGYTSVYFRRQFVVQDPLKVTGLILEALCDDGFRAWINGKEVLSQNIPSGAMAYDGTALQAIETSDYSTFVVNSPGDVLVKGTNILAVHVFNVNRNTSSDFAWDARLRIETGDSSGRGPTPGKQNSVYAESAPPQIRQVEHTPKQPKSNEPVLITTKITDPNGMGSVTLFYQVVEPGAYIALEDSAYRTNWSELVLNDEGRNGDAMAGDSVYSVLLPATLQKHRRLVRYRLQATDAENQTVIAPYEDDPQPNFAYFVYDGMPGWQGAAQPGVTPAIRYGPEVMGRLPIYHLLSKKESVEQATWTERYRGDLYKWIGTLIYDGKVYDHIHYRARGGVWRYAMGKNMWKFDFNRGHDFEAKDNFGKNYLAGWTKLNLGAGIQQGDYLHRGEHGMFEAVGFKLFNLAGIEAPGTHWAQLRIIDEAQEANPNDQYQGDLWGLYLAVEQEDGRFLDAHNLPDGNFYKMEGGSGELNNLGRYGPADKSDLNSFISTYQNDNPAETWWRTNLDLSRYYAYRSMVEMIHHYDIDEGAGKNYFYYRNPETGLWSVHPWDLDLTWANNMYGGGNSPFKNRVLPKPAFNLEYRNRLREIRDLLFNTDQAYQLIDEYAAIISDSGQGPSMVDVDRAMWDYNPVMASSYVNPSKAGQGRFYKIVPSQDFAGMVRLMKDWVVSRGAWVDANLAKDDQIPRTPSVTSTSPTQFPIDRLTFRTTAFQGVAGSFAALQWRVAEITPAGNPAYDPQTPRHYEIEADWISPELTRFEESVVVPASAVKVGHTYRIRARMKDSTGRWSHWSAPLEFTPGEPEQAGLLRENLQLSELMYRPVADDSFEFIELYNASQTETLSLNGAAFTAGISYIFTNGITLAPEGYLVLAKAANLDEFRQHYQLSTNVQVVGPYSGNLSDSGEQLTLKTAVAGSEIVSLLYSDEAPWPPQADGGGMSLQLRLGSGNSTNPASWHAALPTPGRGLMAQPDQDKDGMPDEWELLHHLNPQDPGDALLDADQDGLNNLEEWRCGTNPADPGDALRLEVVAHSSDQVLLRFYAQAGKSYQLESKGMTGESTWTVQESYPYQATSGWIIKTNAPTSVGRLFRLAVPQEAAGQ